jgi:hypothetical protein
MYMLLAKDIDVHKPYITDVLSDYKYQLALCATC